MRQWQIRGEETRTGAQVKAAGRVMKVGARGRSRFGGLDIYCTMLGALGANGNLSG